MRDSLAPPPIAPPPPAGIVTGAGCRRGGHPTTLRLKFRRSAWLCADVEGDVVLHTNIANGQSFASDASPSFQILPHCVAGATMLIESDVDAGYT